MKIAKRYFGKSRVELIPLIDVMFLLLATFIFSILSMTIHRGIPVDLPKASTSSVDKKDVIGISISSDGNIFLERKEVTEAELLSRLVSLRNKSKEVKVIISGDKRASYEKVVSVMDLVRISGIVSLSLETKWEK
ncbi:MAG: biopolymer transporter ExbD [Syntrophales bacterium]